MQMWGKTLAAIVTPMEGGKINYALAARLAKSIISHGCDGVVACGTTGEAATLSKTEKLALIDCLGQAVGGAGRVIAGVGSNNTEETVALIRQVEKLPADGYMVITPYYNKPNSQGLLQHYQAVDAACTKPIMLYNVPSRTGMCMSQADYSRILAACPQITAVKEASGNVAVGANLLANHPGIAWFSGNDDLTLPLMAIGFQGVVSVAANVAPKEVAQLTSLISQGNWQAARTINRRLLPLFTALFLETNPVPVKAALEMLGFPVGTPRLPLAGLSAEHRQQLAAVVNKISGEGR